MSVTDLDEMLVARPEEAQDINKIMQAIAADERSGRRLRVLLTLAPWAVATIFGLFAVGAGIVVAKRPVPEPDVRVAIYRSDGTFEGPVDRGNLSEDRKKFIVKADLQQFIVAWESYAWRANQSYYSRISAMTSGQPLQTQYQQSWRERTTDNRDLKYGDGVTLNVAAIQTTYMPDAPFALTGRVLVKKTTTTGSTCEWRTTNLTFKRDNNTIPLDAQLLYDPSDTIVVSYSSNPLDPAAKPWAC